MRANDVMGLLEKLIIEDRKARRRSGSQNTGQITCAWRVQFCMLNKRVMDTTTLAMPPGKGPTCHKHQYKNTFVPPSCLLRTFLESSVQIGQMGILGEGHTCRPGHHPILTRGWGSAGLRSR